MFRFPAKTFATIATPPPREDDSVVLGRAAVLGGSIAGLLAARVLAQHAEDVVVVERDEPDGHTTGARPGVPQGDQVHLLLPAGQAQVERWFPGFFAQAVAQGACVASPGARRTYVDGRLKVRGSDLDLLSASRPFIEGLLRRQLGELPNVSYLRARATDLRFDGTAVTGVSYDAPGGPGTLDVEFVVDAMGRASRLNDWLGRHGWDRAPMTRMSIDLNYATTQFRRTEATPEIVSALAICSARRNPDVAGGAITAVEGDRWLLMLAGYGTCRPGHDAADLIRRCRADFPPEFGRVVESEMLGPVRTYHQADSRRRDFQLCRRLPAGLVSVGDAVASFNPVYGQGMSSAALHASCLAMYLRGEPDPRVPARDFFTLQRVIIDAAWSMSTAADLARPSVSAPRPRGHWASTWATNQVIEASIVDPTVNRRFDEVAYMLRHPTALATPGTLLRALTVNRRARRRTPVAG